VAVDAARVGELPRGAHGFGREILRAVNRLNRNPADGGELAFGRLHGCRRPHSRIKKAGSEEPANYELEAGTVPPEISPSPSSISSIPEILGQLHYLVLERCVRARIAGVPGSAFY